MGLVSIPFIAGQWSLRAGAARAKEVRHLWSQSPSLRGSGRFAPHPPKAGGECVGSLNPLHCGAVVASRASARPPQRWRCVSIPFIAGQWSLPLLASARTSLRFASQSPSLRGSGRFKNISHPFLLDVERLNPLHCGAVVASGGARRRIMEIIKCLNPLHCGAVVASTGRALMRAPPTSRLNPLHCGAVVASRARTAGSRNARPVSIPFIAGQWSLLLLFMSFVLWVLLSQSPSLRGSGRFATSR